VEKRKIFFDKKGFTLLEVAIAVIVIAVLATFGFMTYARFLERARITEADNVIGSAMLAQQRYFLKYNRYTNYWHRLDSVPGPVKEPKAQNNNANGLENTVYYPRGGVTTGELEPGFAISFETDSTNKWFAVGRRVGRGGYTYELVRPFDQNRTICVPGSENEKDVDICIDYMGIAEGESLPSDPRRIDAD
jgi:prepilin-type N-terminal cleavage/methylation domain-containing protein